MASGPTDPAGGGGLTSVSEILAASTITPIAQLGPHLAAENQQTALAVRGEVTIVWPFNSVKRSLAFLLAEPDVRLRRQKGQIRVQLNGACAAAVAKSGLGSGDELLLSLDSASWGKDESSLNLPGSRVEWQLEFHSRFVLQAKLGEDQETRDILVDGQEEEKEEPEEILEEELVDDHAVHGSFSHGSTQPSTPRVSDQLHHARVHLPFLNNEEYASPAFLKRARISFGSLYEPGYDIFEDDGGVRGRGRKRTRFGRPSNAWRYSSVSVSPEPEPQPEPEEVEEDAQAPENGAVEDATPKTTAPPVLPSSTL